MLTNLVKLLLNGNASFMPDKNTGQELWSTSTCYGVHGLVFSLLQIMEFYFYFIMRKRGVNFIIFHLVSVHKNCLDPKKKKTLKEFK